MSGRYQQKLDAPADKTCAMCEKIGAYACPICEGPMYCGEEHQKMHWVRHEAKCNVVHTKDINASVLTPFDLIDDQGLPVSVKTMCCATDSKGTQHVTVIESRVGPSAISDGVFANDKLADSRLKKELAEVQRKLGVSVSREGRDIVVYARSGVGIGTGAINMVVVLPAEWPFKNRPDISAYGAYGRYKLTPIPGQTFSTGTHLSDIIEEALYAIKKAEKDGPFARGEVDHFTPIPKPWYQVTLARRARTRDEAEAAIGQFIQESSEHVGARRWSLFGMTPKKERAPKGTPSLQSPGLLRGIGPDEGVGAGRAPTDAEKDGGNGNVKITLEYWRTYMDKTKDRSPDGKWQAVATVDDSNIIYQANSDERVRAIANLRVDRARDGLVVWFDQAALDQKRIDLPVSGGYLQLTVKTSWNNREMATNMVYGTSMRVVRTLGTGWAARRMLQAKGLESRSDRVLYMHDKRIGSDVRVSMVVRTARGSRVMRLVDMEVFIPDLKGFSTEDSPLDADADIQIPLVCNIDNQAHVDGLICALKEELALMDTIKEELVRSPIQLSPQDRSLMRTAERNASRIGNWLDVLEPHSARLQTEGPSFVGASYGDNHSDVYQAVNQATSYMLVEAGFFSNIRKRFRKGADKVTQRQYESKIKSEGLQWALDKLGDADWQQNPGKLANLKKALERTSRTGKLNSTEKKRLEEAMRLVNQYLSVQEPVDASY